MSYKFAIDIDPNDNPEIRTKRYEKFMKFKDFKGIKKVDRIKDAYQIGRILGEGNFGVVRIAE